MKLGYWRHRAISLNALVVETRHLNPKYLGQSQPWVYTSRSNPRGVARLRDKRLAELSLKLYKGEDPYAS